MQLIKLKIFLVSTSEAQIPSTGTRRDSEAYDSRVLDNPTEDARVTLPHPCRNRMYPDWLNRFSSDTSEIRNNPLESLFRF